MFFNFRVKTQAPWHCTKESLEYITSLCDDGILRGRSNWTTIPNYMGNTSGWKIAECIAFLDDQGLYLFGLLEFNEPMYKPVFLSLLKTLKEMLTFDVTKRSLTTLQDRLNQVYTFISL